MATPALRDGLKWDDSEAAIAAVLERLCQIIAPDRDEAGIRDLQTLTDKLLDQRPAETVAGLEHRLECLCGALETLGPWAEPQVIVNLAVKISRRFH